MFRSRYLASSAIQAFITYCVTTSPLPAQEPAAEQQLSSWLVLYRHARTITAYSIDESAFFRTAVLPEQIQQFADFEFSFAAESKYWKEFWKAADNTSISPKQTPGDFRWVLIANGSSEHPRRMLAVDRRSRVVWIAGRYYSARGSLFRWLKSLPLSARQQQGR